MEIIGLPGGMAARHFGFDPVQWQAAMDLRAQVIRGLDKAAPAVKRRPARHQEKTTQAPRTA